LSAFYLGWLVQAMFLQRPQDYVMITTIFPATMLVASALQIEWKPSRRGPALLVFGVTAIILTLGLRPECGAMWVRCWREGSTPALQDELALNARWSSSADWQDLARVADFLRREGATDGEVTCLTGCTHWLYLQLGLEPSTRFPQVQ